MKTKFYYFITQAKKWWANSSWFSLGVILGAILIWMCAYKNQHGLSVWWTNWEGSITVMLWTLGLSLLVLGIEQGPEKIVAFFKRIAKHTDGKRIGFNLKGFKSISIINGTEDKAALVSLIIDIDNVKVLLATSTLRHSFYIGEKILDGGSDGRSISSTLNQYNSQYEFKIAGTTLNDMSQRLVTDRQKTALWCFCYQIYRDNKEIPFQQVSNEGKLVISGVRDGEKLFEEYPIVFDDFNEQGLSLCMVRSGIINK